MRYGVAMSTYGSIIPKLGSIRRTTTLSKPAKRRLQWMEFYESHGRNARLACRHFGISPDVFYRWKRRYNPKHLAALEDTAANRRPKHLRTPTTDEATVTRIKQLREQYPRWGKKKLHALLVDEGFRVSEPTVGRTLTRLRKAGRLNEPPIVTARLAGKKRRSISRPYAKRRDWSYIPEAPGHLVQVDTLHVRDEEQRRYQFTARTAAYGVTATSAASILDALEDRLPVPIKAIQVDGVRV